ncbi:MAG: hypothetical protein ABR947_08100 [Solirubrobacteraceae bacterium]
MTLPLNVAEEVPTPAAEPVITTGPAGPEVEPVADVLPVESESTPRVGVPLVDPLPVDPPPLPLDPPPVVLDPLPVVLDPLPLDAPPVVFDPLPVVLDPPPLDALPLPLDAPPEEVVLAGKPSFASRASCARAAASAVWSVASCCSSVVTAS